MTRYLVTTADPRAWPDAGHEPIILWRSCTEKDGAPCLAEAGGRLAAPFYPDVPGRLALEEDARRIYGEIIPRLAAGLNAFHGITWNDRQWEIVAGPFLKRYIRIVINRYLKLEHVLRMDGVERSIHLSRDADVVPRDTLHLINLSEDDAWNHEICRWLLRDFFPEVRVESIPVEPEDPPGTSRSGAGGATPRGGVLRRFLEWLRARRRIFIYDLHASRSLKIRFYLLAGQLPIRPMPFEPPSLRGPDDRGSLELGALVPEKKSAYEEALERYLPRLLPRALVEAFPHNRIMAEAGPHPRRSRVIVTSTAFDADERFKTWVAQQVGLGARYVVLQHGAVYGANPFFADTVEERTADAFVTWGWCKTPRHVPVFCLNTPGWRIHRCESADRLLLVTLTQRRKKFIWDVETEFDAYMDAQYRFVDGLDLSVRDRLTIRLHQAHVRAGGRQKERFEARYPNVDVDLGEVPLRNLLASTRLMVFTYDSTGLLELLSINHPVVAFWNEDGFDQVSGAAREHYAMLEEAGVLHYSPAALAALISRNWHRIDEWWSSPQVQEARREFCASYAAPAAGGARRLRRIILDAGGGTE